MWRYNNHHYYQDDPLIMFLIESKLSCPNNDYEEIFSEIDRAMAKVSTYLLDYKRYRTGRRINKVIFDNLSDYRSILEWKQMCDTCLKDYPLSQIITNIRKLTNSIL